MKTKEWAVNVYEKHIGIVDGNGVTVASVGARGEPHVWHNARLIVKAVNKLLNERERNLK